MERHGRPEHLKNVPALFNIEKVEYILMANHHDGQHGEAFLPDIGLILHEKKENIIYIINYF